MKRLTEANRRLRTRLSRKDKVYPLSYHNSKSMKPYIILNPEVIKGYKQNELIVLSFESNLDIKLIFKLTNENFVEQQTKKSISIHKNIADLIIKKYNFNPNKSRVYVRKTDKENLAIKDIEIELKEYIPRSELFHLTVSMINDCIITGQEIYNKDNKVVGVVSKLSNNSLTGFVSFTTNFKMTSLMSDIYLMFDISKSSYNYNSYFYMNYEVIIDYVKNILLKLKNQTTYHNIHIYFYIRIFFKGNGDYKQYKFIRKEPHGDNNYYFDIYDKIEMFNAEHIDIKEIIYKMNIIYQNYENIQNEKYQKQHFKNLNQFLFSIRNNLQCPLGENERDILDENMNVLSYTFDGYETLREGEKPKECMALSDNIFDDVTEFEISSFNAIGIFEAIIFTISQIENNKKNKNRKYNPLINIVLSGESFPYYSSKLADKVRSSVFEEYINLVFTYLCPRNKVSIFSKNKTSINIDNEDEERYKTINDNDEYFNIDNFKCDIPGWCQIYYVPHSLLYKNLYKYKRQYKVSLLSKQNNNSDEFNDLHKIFDEKMILDIISLHFKEEKNEVEINNKNINNNNDNNKKSKKKKLTLEDMIQRYTITKPPIVSNNIPNNIIKRDSAQEELKNDLAPNEFNSMSYDLDNLGMNDEGKDNNYFDIKKKTTYNNNLQIEKNINELDILEDLFTNVPIPYFIEYAKDLRIEPKIVKCYIVKNDIDLILKRIDNYFNIIVDNEKDEIMETIKNIILKPSNYSFNEKFLITNRKIMNILEFKTNQVEVFQYEIMRKRLYFKYYYVIANSINGSVFAKTNNQHIKKDWQKEDNYIRRKKSYHS